MTLSRKHRKVQAIAVSHGRIQKVGTNEQVLSAIGKETEAWNLGGAIILPGFTDCHTHLVGYGLELSGANLREARSISEIQTLLRKQAKDAKQEDWVLGYGWDQEKLAERRLPNRSDLDAAVPDKPVCVIRICEHICAVNTAGLRLAGVDSKTVSPPGGIIEIDSKTGEPTGLLQENAMNIVLSKIPPPAHRQIRKATALAMHKALSSGLTAVYCVVDQPEHIRVLQAMNRAGQLKLRIYLLVPDEWLRSATEIGLSSGFGDSMLRMQGIKIFTDGSLGARTAALEAPYSDAPETTGMVIDSQDQLNAKVENAASHGWPVAVHAIGDRAIGMALTAIEHANAVVSESSSLRHRIEHASVLTPSLIERMRREKVIASVQPHFIVSDRWVPARVGPTRAEFVYPLKALVEAKVAVVAGSDCPVEPIDPLRGIQAAVSSDAREYGKPVSLRTAIELFTKNSAYASHEEKVKGTIEEGKLADLVILDRDPFEVPPEEISRIKTLATIVGGRLVYAAMSFQPRKTSRVRRRRGPKRE